MSIMKTLNLLLFSSVLFAATLQTKAQIVLYTTDFASEAELKDWTLSNGASWNGTNGGLLELLLGSYALMPALPSGPANLTLTVTAFQNVNYIEVHTSPDA